MRAPGSLHSGYGPNCGVTLGMLVFAQGGKRKRAVFHRFGVSDGRRLRRPSDKLQALLVEIRLLFLHTI